jgi:hypothetical protein
MLRLSASAVLIALALWLGWAGTASAEEYTKYGTIKNVNLRAMTFDLDCTDPTEKWKDIHFDKKHLENVQKWEKTRTKVQVEFTRKGDRSRALNITLPN